MVQREMNQLRLTVWTACLGLLSALPLYATEDNELSLDDLLSLQVYTASNAPEPIYEAPNVMYVYTRETLVRRGLRNLREVFQVTPGLGVQHKDLQYVGQVRGIAPNDNEKIALMVNGHVINNVAEPDFFNGGSFPLDFVDRIEIIVGPGGVFYGGEPLCAIINLITPNTDQQELIMSLGGGSQDPTGTRSLEFMTGKIIGDSASFFASGSYYQKEGFDAWRENSTNTRNAVLSQYDDVTGKVLPSYQMFLKSTLGEWSGQFFSQNSQIPELHLLGFGAATDGRRSDLILSTELANHRTWKYGLGSDLKISSDHKRYVRGIYSVGSGDANYDNYDNAVTTYGADISLQHTLAERNFFQIGFQGKQSQHRQNYALIANPSAPWGSASSARFLIQPGNTYAGGMYVSDKLTVKPWLKLVAAMRLDRNSILDSVPKIFFDAEELYWAPRAAILFDPGQNFHLKVMYNVANRLDISPWSSSRNNIWGKGKVGAPEWATQNSMATQPEQLATYETQAMYYWYEWKFQVNVWHQNLRHFISWYSPFTNVGDFSGYGAEYEIQGSPTAKLTLWTNGSLCTNDFRVTAMTNQAEGEGSTNLSQSQLPANPEGEVLSVPKFTANAGFDLRIWRNLNLSPTLRYFTAQPMAVPDSTGPNYGYADNRFYIDAALSYDDIPLYAYKLNLRAVVKNIAGNRDLVSTQWLADAIYPEGRTWELRAGIQF